MSIFKFQKFNSFFFKNKASRFKHAPKLTAKKKYTYFTKITYNKKKKLKLKKKKNIFYETIPTQTNNFKSWQ
jgi:hypothetical protein